MTSKLIYTGKRPIYGPSCDAYSMLTKLKGRTSGRNTQHISRRCVWRETQTDDTHGILDALLSMTSALSARKKYSFDLQEVLFLQEVRFWHARSALLAYKKCSLACRKSSFGSQEVLFWPETHG